jgi:hypothetical protein
MEKRRATHIEKLRALATGAQNGEVNYGGMAKTIGYLHRNGYKALANNNNAEAAKIALNDIGRGKDDAGV